MSDDTDAKVSLTVSTQTYYSICVNLIITETRLLQMEKAYRD